MKKIISLILILLLIFVNTASSSNLKNIEEKTNEQEYWAVVVTIVDYEWDVNDLNIPVDMMYTPLISAPNWNEDNVLFIKNENATLENILKSLDWLANQVDENDIALFYYGGHGLKKEDQNGDEKDGIDEGFATYEGEFLRDDDLKLKLDNISAEGLFVLIDCCLSAGATDTENTLQKIARANKQSDFNNGLQEEIKGQNMVVIASTFEKTIALEVKGFGTVLTLSLKRIISKSQGDTNQDGIISAEETYIQLKKIFRRLNFFLIAGAYTLLKLIELTFAKNILKIALVIGISSIILWEIFSIVVYGGVMIPYYPLIYDGYEGELPFIE